MREKLIENFLRISNIPRKSGSEKQISDFFVDIAKKNNLYYYQDNNYNLLIKKKGNIQGDTIAFQAHFDMVCVKNENSTHNFDTDPIDVVIDGDKVVAKDTTLGADQGVGLAIMLALIEDDSIKHPDLEFMFTVEEETTFKGAVTFPYDKVSSKKIINLDYCRDDSIAIGSSGDIANEYIFEGELIKRDLPSYKITIDGLKGGNSGEYIERSSSNAIASIAKLLENKEIYLKSINGGTYENDIAVYCEVILQTSIDMKELFKDKNITIEEVNNDESFSLENSKDIINKIIELKSGYISNTSSGNLGIIRTNDNKVIMTYLYRSIDSKELEEFSDNLNDNFIINNLYADRIWLLNKDIELFNKYKDVYYRLYKEYPKEIIIQGGIEIASINKRIKDLEIISIGANMEDIHTPSETTYISSWEKVYNIIINFLNS